MNIFGPSLKFKSHRYLKKEYTHTIGYILLFGLDYGDRCNKKMINKELIKKSFKTKLFKVLYLV